VTGVELVKTSGEFTLDGQTFAVDNNVWIIGDSAECLVIDPAHDAEPVLAAIGGRRVTAIVCTHAHNDHITGAVPLAEKTGAPVLLHPADRELWDQRYPGRAPDGELAHGEVLAVAGIELQVLHTPGHTWGSVCLHAPALGALFSGDTLFLGGPGATGRSYSDFGTIVDSITRRLLVLDPGTTVHTGHGMSTTIGAEAPQRAEWLARGH